MWSTKRYLIELGGAMTLYAVLLVAANMAERAWQPDRTGAIALSLLPVIGCVAALVAIMRGVRRMDELGRRVQFEAVTFAFAATALVTLTWGFLEDDGVPHLRAFMVWPIMAAFWGIGGAMATWRYR
jgi:hypothetical protein